MKSRETVRDIPEAEVAKGLEDGITQSDVMRAEGFERLHTVYSVKDKQYEREQKRLSEKLGKNHPRVLALNEKMKFNSEFTVALEKQVVRAKINSPVSDDKAWILHGRVMDEDENPLPGLLVGFADARKKSVEGIELATTDKEGYFKINVPLDKSTAASRKMDKAAKDTAKETYATDNRAGIFVLVTDKQRSMMHIDDQLFSPLAGVVDYREIVIEEELVVCIPKKCDKPEEKKRPGIKMEEKNINPENKKDAPKIKKLSTGIAKKVPRITRPK